jgi:hypothetical protein
VAEDVADELRALHLSQLADRAGPQWGGGYVDPHDAADEMLDETVQPYLEDSSDARGSVRSRPHGRSGSLC